MYDNTYDNDNIYDNICDMIIYMMVYMIIYDNIYCTHRNPKVAFPEFKANFRSASEKFSQVLSVDPEESLVFATAHVKEERTRKVEVPKGGVLSEGPCKGLGALDSNGIACLGGGEGYKKRAASLARWDHEPIFSTGFACW